MSAGCVPSKAAQLPLRNPGIHSKPRWQPLAALNTLVVLRGCGGSASHVSFADLKPFSRAATRHSARGAQAGRHNAWSAPTGLRAV
jgi:hypothetical protein